MPLLSELITIALSMLVARIWIRSRSAALRRASALRRGRISWIVPSGRAATQSPTAGIAVAEERSWSIRARRPPGQLAFGCEQVDDVVAMKADDPGRNLVFPGNLAPGDLIILVPADLGQAGVDHAGKPGVMRRRLRRK